MLNAAQLAGLDRAQQFQRVSDALKSGALDKSQAVALAKDLGFPKDMQWALAESKLVVAGYGDPAAGGAHGHKPLPATSPLFAGLSSVTSAYLRAIKGPSSGGVIDSTDVARTADGLGHQGKRDQQVDTVERGTLKRIGENLGVDSKILTTVDAMAAGATDLKIDVPDAPQKPERLPGFFDFESIHEFASSGVGARAVLFNDKEGNFLRVLEENDGSFILKFLERQSLPPGAKSPEIKEAFEKASPMPMAEDIAAFLADKIVAMTFKETGSTSFEAYEYNKDIRAVVTQTATATGDATPDWVDFTQYNGSGGSSRTENGGRAYSLMLREGCAFVRASKTPGGYATEIAYLRGENAAWADKAAREYRPISEGEAQRIRDAVDLENVRGRLWTKFFGGTQLVRQVARSQ